MSFGYAVGDVIAVLGLFERIAIELRNYKDAPAHFQQLSLELDLIRSTLQHVLRLDPEDEGECQTLEKMRAIAMHCMQPLQAIADKMRSKEGSLGHFRTTRSLSNIGTRLHWSMLDKKDVDELRKTILSEMVALNMLLSVQQLRHIRQLSSRVQGVGDAQSAFIEKHSDALIKQTSTILSIVSSTPSGIADLRSIAIMQAEKQLAQAQALDQRLAAATHHLKALSLSTTRASAMVRQHAASMSRTAKSLLSLMQDIKKLFILLAACSKEMLEAIGRNTHMLLDIASQMKRVVRAIEAIPLHLTLDIVRLDDALGESWALPLQACTTWDSFRDLLQNVVYANGRVGAGRIANNQFVITLANTGSRLRTENWTAAMKAGLHVEQAMVVSGVNAIEERCPYPGCSGLVSGSEHPGNPHGKVCSMCSRSAIREKAATPIIRLFDSPSTASGQSRIFETATTPFGPSLPAMQPMEEFQHFRRVQILETPEPIRDMADAYSRLEADRDDLAANAFIALRLLQETEKAGDNDDTTALERAVQQLQAATTSAIGSTAEPWYILARVFLRLGMLPAAYDALQQAVYRNGRSTSIWNTVGILYYLANQHRDSLDSFARAIRLNPYIDEPWYNLGVLYEARTNQHTDVMDAFRECLLNLPDVEARYQLLRKHRDDAGYPVPDDYKITKMRYCKLVALSDEAIEYTGPEIVFHPIRGSGRPDLEDSDNGETTSEGGSSSKWESTDEE